MKWVVMIVSKDIKSHVAYVGVEAPLVEEDRDAKVFDSYDEAADTSKKLVHMLSPLEITQVRIISDVFMLEGA